MLFSLPLTERYQRSSGDDELDVFYPLGTFEVDGLHYRRTGSDVHVRPILDLLDTTDGGSPARMACNDPMNEHEIDHYLKTGQYLQPEVLAYDPSPERTDWWLPDSVTARNSSSD